MQQTKANRKPASEAHRLFTSTKNPQASMKLAGQTFSGVQRTIAIQ
jgi:hypothetical protein